LLPDAERGDQIVRVDVLQTKPVQSDARGTVQALLLDHAAAPGQPVQKNILGHRERRNQVQLLLDDLHASGFGCLFMARLVNLAQQPHASASRRCQASNDPAQRALASAIGP
jgi:hypothetical protein